MSRRVITQVLYLTALVALGSGLGACLRALLGVWLGAGTPEASVWSTALANVSGALLIGWLAARTQFVRGARMSPELSAFLMTGFCGGYTTLSLFSLEMLRWLQTGAREQVLLYALASVVVWLFAVACGWYLGRPRGTA